MWYDATSAAGSLEDPKSVEGGRQGRLRLRAGQEDEVLRLAVHVGVGDREGEQEPRQRVEVRLLGLEQGVREARRREAGLGAGARRQARVAVREPGVPEGRGGLLQDDPGLDRRRPIRRTRACSRGPPSGSSSSDIPEFTKLGTDVSQFVSSAIAGKTSVDDALNKGQKMAEDVAKKYQGQVDDRRLDDRCAGRPPRGRGAPAQRRLVAAGAAAAGADLHDHRHAAAVRRDAGDLDAGLELVPARRAQLRVPRQLQDGVHRRRAARGGGQHGDLHRGGRADLGRARARDRAAARPQRSAAAGSCGR